MQDDSCRQAKYTITNPKSVTSLIQRRLGTSAAYFVEQKFLRKGSCINLSTYAHTVFNYDQNISSKLKFGFYGILTRYFEMTWFQSICTSFRVKQLVTVVYVYVALPKLIRQIKKKYI